MSCLIYQIRISGHLAQAWSDWFDGMAIEYEGPDTTLTGPVLDQSALYGRLIKLRDLGLVLLRVEQVGAQDE